MMQGKILICGEGSTDYGAKEFGTNQWLDGPVQPIVCKTVKRNLLFEAVDKNEVKQLRIQGRAGVKGHAAKSYKLCLIARERKMNDVICYVDADNVPGKGSKEANAREAFFSVYGEVKEGFEVFNRLFSDGLQERGIRGIPMVPLRMIESWLLSDERAYAKCFGEIPSHPRLPARPEFIWGEKNDPKGDYPKSVMNRVLKQYHGQESNRVIFKEIALAMDIETLRKKCPISFEAFYKDINGLPVTAGSNRTQV